MKVPGEDDAFQKCIRFLKRIGISTFLLEEDMTGLLPGLSIENGSIFINRKALQFPGDILHEAGHIAVVPFSDRHSLRDEGLAGRVNREAEELMAIAWSYAACMHLDLPADFVFHEKGYRGGSSFIMESFAANTYFGTPMLQVIGLSAEKKKATKLKVLPFPHMLKWLRD